MRTKLIHSVNRPKDKDGRGQNTHIYFRNSGQEEMSMDMLERRDSQRQSTYWTESLKKEQVTGDRLQ